MSMAVYTGDNFVDLFPRIVKSLLERGELTNPRRLPTLELRPLIIQIQNPHHRFIDSGLINYPLMIIKQMQWLAGIVDMKALQRFDPKIVDRVDPKTGLYDGAYGPKLRPQLEFAYRLLRRDLDTRRAIVSIFQSSDQRDGLDTPTTLALQFLLRNSKLNMITYMRSNDVWSGLPTDIHLFAFLQEVMAAWLNVELGEYYHISGSGHIYKSSVEDIKLWLNSSAIASHEQTPPLYGSSFEDSCTAVDRFLEWERSLSGMSAEERLSAQPTVTDPYLKWAVNKVLEYYQTQQRE